MHEPTQLDLFQKPVIPMRRRARKKRTSDEEPPVGTGNVLRLFPFARRKSLVEATADRLVACGGRKAKQAAWDRVVLALADEARALGGDEGEVVRQLCEFHDAVDQAIRKERGEPLSKRRL